VVVRVKDRFVFSGVVRPTALGTETVVVDLPDYPEFILVEGYIDVSALDSGDVLVVNVYLAVDGVTRRLYDTVTLSGVVPTPVVRVTPMYLRGDSKFRVTINQTGGALRDFPFWFIVLVHEVI
jgi:sugar lactone lactonase YvrE